MLAMCDCWGHHGASGGNHIEQNLCLKITILHAKLKSIENSQQEQTIWLRRGYPFKVMFSPQKVLKKFKIYIIKKKLFTVWIFMQNNEEKKEKKRRDKLVKKLLLPIFQTKR